MARVQRAITAAGILLVLPMGAWAGVGLNEIAWMGTDVSATDEWVELYNSSSADVSLNGWRLTARDGSPEITLSGAIPVGGYFLLERTSDGTVPGIAADQIYTGALSNSGEYLELKDAAGVVVDALDASGGWPAGDNTSKDTMQWNGSVWLTASPTPRQANAGAAPTPSPLPPPSPTPSPPVSSPSPPAFVPLETPTIRAYAGEDRVAVAGAAIEFLGRAINQDSEEVEGLRFWWNFGDGETSEGRAVAHAFRLPGSYLTGLHVSSGGYASSDYLTTKVVPNQLTITHVVGGESGFVRLANPSDLEIEIGGWILEQGMGKQFFFPPRTRIGARSEISLANAVSGLLQNGIVPLTLHYPNHRLAVAWQQPIAVQTPPSQGHSPAPPAPGALSAPALAPLLEPSSPREEETPNTGEVAVIARAGGALAPPAAGQGGWFFAGAVALGILGGVSFLLFRPRA